MNDHQQEIALQEFILLLEVPEVAQEWSRSKSETSEVQKSRCITEFLADEVGYWHGDVARSKSN